MVVGTGLVDLLIPESGSLKEKRSVLKRIIQRTRNEFNVSIAEVGDNDLWRRARVGFSVVGNDKQYINAKMDHILRFIDRLGLAEILRSRIEIVSFDDLMDTDDIEEGKYE
ncbi:MAG: DUF503 domain-containing protein [Syntrophales bacterium]